MIKQIINNFKMYYKQFNTLSFSIFFLPFNIYLLKFFTPIKKIRLTNFNNQSKVVKLRADNIITHFRANLFFSKEKEVRLFIDNQLRENDIFFDVGANIGIFSIYAAVRKNAKVYAFEPEYSNLSILKENILKNSLKNNIHPYSIAIGKNNHITNLHVADITPGAAVSSISDKDLKTTDEGFNVVWKEGIVEMKIDDICKQLNIIPNMLKIDTDGNEKNVLIGAENTLKSSQLKCIIMEKPSNKENLKYSYEFLNKNGFEEINISQARNSFWKKGE